MSLGTMGVSLGIFLACHTATPAENRAVARRYLGTDTTGEAIEQGMVYLLIGAVLYLLCVIARNSGARGE